MNPPSPPQHRQPAAPGGGAVHHPSTGPLDGATVAGLRCRPPHLRTAVPFAGARVGLRMTEFGPVVAATVVRVLGMETPGATSSPDLMVWRVATDESSRAVAGPGPGGYAWGLVDDPWPVLMLRVDPVGGKGQRLFVESREERLTPYGGWLPASEIAR